MIFYRSLCLSIFLGVFLSASLFASRSADIRAFTGAPTKVVWVQDAGDIACVFSERPTLRLMGLYTEDGKGERAILPEIARYSKPIITDDGTRVAFGDLDKKTVHIVNWDGTGLRTVLTQAQFEDVWTDPHTGIVWIYAKVEESRGDKMVGVIRRYQLDDPSVNELIWDKTPVYNFMVNGDGRAASGGISDGGNTPQGVFMLPNISFNQRAGGCWPSMSPDNSLRSWVFTGNHRSIHFGVTTDSTGKGYSYGVAFNQSPGLTIKGREELYHPRWSNNVRFLTATAPLYNWSYRADAKIPNDVAAEVEIYLGEFTEDMQGIKRWIKVTDNQRGDYWPDAWIQPPPGPPAWLDDEPVLAVAPTDQPVELDHTAQVFLWHTAIEGNQLVDTQTGSIHQYSGQLRDAARFDQYGVLDLNGGAFIPDNAAGPWLQAVKRGGAFAVEAVLTPSAQLISEGVVLAFADAMDQGNVVLAQQEGWLTLRLRGRDADPLRLVRLPAGEFSHVIVSYAPGKLGVYVNGQQVILRDAPTVPVTGWTEQPLILGDDNSGKHDWAGFMESIGLFGREISSSEARQRANAYETRQAERAPVAQRVIVEAKLIDTCPAADPQGIAPYRRCLSVQQYQITKVIDGELTDKVISVAQWSVLDGKVVPAYLDYKVGQTYRLALEAWHDHPEQESERMIMGDFDEEGDMFYQVREPVAPLIVDAAAPGGSTEFWTTLPSQPNMKWLEAPVTIRDEANPTLFAEGSQVQLDTAGQSVTLEAASMPKIPIAGTVRFGGSGALKSGQMTVGGLGYTSAPPLTLSGGGGEGGELWAGMEVTGLDLVNLGAGYTDLPTVTIAPPDIYGGRQATAVAYIDKASGAVTRLQITDGGSGYRQAPWVQLTGGGGSGVQVRATLSLHDVYVLNEGRDYATPPTVSIQGGGGQGAQAQAFMQRTVVRYTNAAGDAMIHNTGTIDQDAAEFFFDWAADKNNSGTRGINNVGVWIMRRGAMTHFGSSTGRPNWAIRLQNIGTLRMLSGSRLGLQTLDNIGKLQLGAGVRLGQTTSARSEMKINNTGEIQVAGGGDDHPVIFGMVDPSRTGKRILINGTEAGAKEARFVLGDGQESSTFEMIGGDSTFINQPGATLLIRPRATLSLLTNDNGSVHVFISRDARLANRGDLSLSGTLRVSGNHTGFVGLSNQGQVLINGDDACIERLPDSAGPGARYHASRGAQILNLPGGMVSGAGTLTYRNSTGNADAPYLRLINLGEISPGGSQPDRLVFDHINVEFGAVAPPDKDQKKSDASLVGAGLLRILVASASNHGSIEVHGTKEQDSGRFVLTDGAANTLNIVTTGAAPVRGKLRIITAREVVGQFTNLQFNGNSSVPYTVNYLPGAIEVVFP